MLFMSSLDSISNAFLINIPRRPTIAFSCSVGSVRTEAIMVLVESSSEPLAIAVFWLVSLFQI